MMGVKHGNSGDKTCAALLTGIDFLLILAIRLFGWNVMHESIGTPVFSAIQQVLANAMPV